MDRYENEYAKLGNNHLAIFDFRIFNDLCVLRGEIHLGSGNKMGNHGLAEGETAIVAGNLAMDQNFKPGVFQSRFHPFQKETVLKHPPAEGCFLRAALAMNPPANVDAGFYQSIVKFS